MSSSFVHFISVLMINYEYSLIQIHLSLYNGKSSFLDAKLLPIFDIRIKYHIKIYINTLFFTPIQNKKGKNGAHHAKKA